MNKQGSRPLLGLAWHAVLALLIVGIPQGIWGALIAVNLVASPAIPWSAPAMAVVLWLVWRYLGGWGWPRSTSQARRTSLRANPVSGRILAWSLLAGALAIVALAGYWIVMFRLFKMPPNNLPDITKYPLFTLALLVIVASLVSPLSEEAGVRGYFQGFLEGEFRAPVAIVISAVLFAVIHVTQGFLLPKLFVYFLGGLAFGAIAYFANSILASIPVHILGDLTFFTLVWPYDAARQLVWNGGADAGFWIHVAQALLFTGLAVLAFRGLARAAQRAPGPLTGVLEKERLNS